ncbi:MAG: hypothetical protein J0I06_00880 [Planctomycetes bacterium]|nr:hypothetical protein [Planctomycetota bacterium]
MLNVHLRITDAATGRPTPVRVRVAGPDGTHFPPLGRAAEFPGGRNEDVGGHLRLGRERWLYIDGACEVPLPAGVSLLVQAAKGPEYVPLDETATLGAGQIALRFALHRWTDSRCDGWVSVDTRCHFLAPHAALLEAQAEGIDVVNVLAVPFPVLALDANTYTTTPNLLAFSGQEAALERDGCSVVVNTLNAHPVLGKVALLHSHRPVFPLTFGGEDTDDWGVCDWCDQCHRKKGLTVWVDAFEPAAGVTGGEALVAAILGKIDAIEVTGEPRKVPLLPWVYRLWDAGFRVPLVGASGKDSNRGVLGAVRTYANAGGGSWVEAIRAGRRFVSAGPLFDYLLEGGRVRASGRAPGSHGKLEVVANGEVVAAAEARSAPEGTHLRAEIDAPAPEQGWVAVRWGGGAGFAHTAPMAVGSPARKPEAAAALRKLVEQTREWAGANGRYANPKRKQALLDRCEEAARKLEAPA